MVERPPSPPARRSWPSRYQIRRLFVIGFVFAGTVLTNYLNTDGIYRLLMSVGGALIALVNVPALWPRSPNDLPAAEDAPAWRRSVSRWFFTQGVETRRPNQLPRPQPGFRGRRADLDGLTAGLHRQRAPRPPWYARLRHRVPALPPGQIAGPALVLVHGMPGIGKTALVTEFVNQIRREYPGGQLYANLGLGAVPRPSGEVLEEFLTELGWPRERMPDATEDRARVFRTLTQNKRILVVLDAARDGDRLYDLMPAGPQCAVVVTSRRDFPRLGGESYPLGVPGTEDAVSILRSAVAAHRERAPIAGTADDSLLPAVRVVRACGHLPAALKAAAAPTAPPSGLTLSQVAGYLADPATRLDRLIGDGVNVRALFKTEYDDLLPREQKAFQLLTTLEAETFVPWVLVPLLGGAIEMGEAENLMARLSRAHLVDIADRTASGATRYRFHPLVRLYAEEVAEPLDPFERKAALYRVDEAYRGVVGEILRRLGARPTDAQALGRWLPPGEVIDSIARAPDRWARREQQHLVRCIDSAREHWTLRWQVAARLGAFIPRRVEVGRGAAGQNGTGHGGAMPTLAAMEAVLATAARTGPREAQLRVGLARASLLIALERYAEADREIEAVAATAGEHGLPELVATARRRQAEGRIQMGAYGDARDLLDRADEAARAAGPAGEPELHRVAQMRGICASNRKPENWHDGASGPPRTLDDSGAFYQVLARSERARRRCEWDDGDALLAELYREHRSDLRRSATVEYARARLWLHRARGGRDPGYAERAAGYAAEAVLSFQEMGNPLGEVRAGSLLVRALALAGRRGEAREHAERVRAALDPLGTSVAVQLLRARLGRAYAELILLDSGGVPAPRSADSPARPSPADEAVRLLTEASAIFAAQQDWWSQAESQMLLGQATRLAGQPVAAMAPLVTASEAFHRAADRVHEALALRELAETARAIKRA